MNPIDINTMKAEPIFIVGAPRSGTTLLAAMLNNHGHLICGPETQFFSKLHEGMLRRCVSDPAWPRRATQAIETLTLAGHRVRDLFNLSRGEVHLFLDKSEPSIRSMLEALTNNECGDRRKVRWVEKTPNHLLHLDLIRKEFPESPIIRIVRDPRDSALSMRQLPWASQSVPANCFTINKWFTESAAFFANDANTLTIRYEDLLSDPEKVCMNLCQFIQEPFQASMLNTRVSGRSLVGANEKWKVKVCEPLDRTRCYVWRKELPHCLHRVTTVIAWPMINEFGYDTLSLRCQDIEAYPVTQRVIESNTQTFIDAANCNIRIAGGVSPLKSKSLLIVADLINKRTDNYKLLGKSVLLSAARLILRRPTFYADMFRQRTNGIIHRGAALCIRILAKPAFAGESCVAGGVSLQ